jgi:hypothetical protein
MNRESRPLSRLRAFTDERRAGAPRPSGLTGDVDPVALNRREQLAEYRRRLRARAAGLAPAPPPAPNWVPIGPLAVRRGQATTEPVVSGRIQDLAVSADGQRLYAASANGGVWRSADAGRTWEPTMDREDLDPAGVGQQADTLSCGALALVDGGLQLVDRLYLGTGEGHTALDDFRGTGMWVSFDGGTTWRQEDAQDGAATNVLLGQGVFAIAVDPGDSTQAVAATTAGLFRRVSAVPPTWVRDHAVPVGVAALGIMNSVVVADRGGGVVDYYAIPFGGPPLTSSSAGAPRVHGPWATLGVNFPTNQVGRCTLAVSAGPVPVLYALVAFDFPPAPPPPPSPPFGSLHGLYRLDLADPTLTWQRVDNVPGLLFGSGPSFQGWYDQAAVVDPNDVNRIYLGGSHSNGPASLYRCEVTPSPAGVRADCTNLGSRVHPDVHALTLRPGSDRELWVGCDGGVFTTTDARGGPHLFEARNTGLGTMTLNSMAQHPTEDSFGFAGAQDNGGLRFTGSDIWDHQLPGDGGATVIHQNDSRLLNIYTRETLRRTTTDGSRYEADYVSPNLPVVRPAAASNIQREQILFYPPVAYGGTAAPNLVAIGAERVYLSTTFGGGWTRLPNPPGIPSATGRTLVRSIVFASPTRVYAGYTNGDLFRWDQVGGVWQPAVVLRDASAPPRSPITSVVVDPADPTGNSVYVTLGGFAAGTNRVWHVVNPPPAPPATAWNARSGPPPPGGGLLDVQHNVLVADARNAGHLYVGADIGVWHSPDAGANWTVHSDGLPDAPVFDLNLVDLVADAQGPAVRVLRAATHGRGAWEIPLGGGPQPGVELVLRANELDRRRGRNARAGVDLPGNRKRRSTLDRSPDIRLDPPDHRGAHAIDPTLPVDLVQLEDRCDRDQVAVGIPTEPVVTRVHVVVRNRGVTRAGGIQATLLVGRINPGALTISPGDATDVPDLPATWAADVRAGTTIDTGTWKTVGVRTLDDVHAGRPAVATFELPSDILPPAVESAGRRFALLAVLHHVDDALPDGPVAVADVIRTGRHTALRVATGVVVPAPAAGPPGGTGLVVPLTTALLARHRLSAAATGLQAKIDAASAPPVGVAPAVVSPTERYVLALAKAALANLDAGPAAPVAAGGTGAGIGSFSLLGALGFELPAYASLLAPGGGWVADLLRRGTPDPQMSLVKAPAVDLPLRIALRAIGGLPAGDVALAPKVRAFASGMVGAAAAGLVVGPQLADLLAVDTARDWSRHTPSAGAAAVEDAIRRRFLTVTGQPVAPASLLPGAGAVPDELWVAIAATIAEVLGPPDARPKGWAAFEASFDPGDPLTGVRLRNAYELLLQDLRTGSWPAVAWWFLLLPFAMAVPVALLAARGLPHGKAFFTEAASVDERALQELLTVGFGAGAVPSFVYSMILWGLIDEHTEAFVNALVLGLARAGLVVGALAGAGDEDLSAGVRWLGLFTPLAAADAYALVRAVLAGTDRPGDRFVFGLQTFPAISGLTTLGVAGLLKGIKISHTDAGFWAPWAVLTAGLLGAAIPVSIALASRGGYRSWFLRENRSLPVLTSTAALAEAKPDARARGRVFAPDRLWALPGTAAPALPDLRYPAGMRPLVRVWWTGQGDLEIRPGDHDVVFRLGGVETNVAVPAGTTVPQLVALLTGALAGVQAEPEGAGDPPVPFQTPALADPGDPLPAADAPVARTRFLPVGRTKEDGVLINHVPRADLSTQLGLAAAPLDPFPVVPLEDLSNLDDSGLGHAADLAALLAAAAAPSLAPVQVADALPALPDPQLHEVVRVFRRWNLDERRLDEWRTLMSGGAEVEPAPGAQPDPMLRDVLTDPGRPHPAGAPVAAAMGWVPLWRAWLKVASDVTADVSAAVVHADTPVVTMPDGARRPTNAELTDGVRFLLDLGDPPPPPPPPP